MSWAPALFQMHSNEETKINELLSAPSILSKKVDEIQQATGHEASLSDIERSHTVLVRSTFRPFVAIGSDYAVISSTNNNISKNNNSSLVFVIDSSSDLIVDTSLRVEFPSIKNTTSYTALTTEFLKTSISLIEKSTGLEVYKYEPATGALVASDPTQVALAALLLDYATVDAFTYTTQDKDHMRKQVNMIPSAVLSAAVIVRNDGESAVAAGTQFYDGDYSISLPASTIVSGTTLPIKVNSALYSLEIKFTEGLTDRKNNIVPIGANLSDEHAPWLRYCDWVGHRFLSKTAFSAGTSNVIDEYTSDTYNMRVKTMMCEEDRERYGELVGHWGKTECVARDGKYVEKHEIMTGPQVPVAGQTAPLSMTIPTLCWFNDMKNPLPICNLPSVKPQFEFTCAPLSDIVSVVPSAVHLLDKVIHFFSAADEPAVTTIARPISMATYDKSTAVFDYTDNGAPSAWLITHGIQIPPVLHTAFISRSIFTLIRVHKTFTQPISSSDRSYTYKTTNQLRFPCEFMTIGSRHTDAYKVKNHMTGAVVDFSTVKSPDHWHKFARVLPEQIPRVTKMGANVSAIDYDRCLYRQVNPINSFLLSMHNTKWFNQEKLTNNMDFFNKYLPYTRNQGESKLKKFTDAGILLVPFCYNPGAQNPSGYLNFTRVRDVEMSFTFSQVEESIGSASQPQSEIVLNLQIINFIICTSGSIVLRFTA